jgi:hypothetical protein
MTVRKREGSLTKEEKRIVKALLARKMRNQDIQALLNKGRAATVNSARITEVKGNNSIEAASDEDVSFFVQRKQSYDPRTGLNHYDDERLIRAREAMILAVQVFNSPSYLFKTEIFAVLACVAWTYLLHEFYGNKKKIEIIGKDGRSLLLSQMIERIDFPLSKGIKNNIAAMIDIRNDVEHKLLRKGGQKFYGLFQACCLNFDKALCELFGENASLQHELSLALQFSSFNFEQIETIHKYDLTPGLEAIDAKLEGRLSDAEKQDTEYQLKVVYTLQSAAKNKAHIQFIRPDSAEGREIHCVLEKHKISDELYPFKPQQVWKEVSKKTKKAFNARHHTLAMYFYRARPSGGCKQPENTNKDYCIYHAAHNDYTYSQAWIDFLIKCVLNDDEFEKIKSFKTVQSKK